MKAIGIVLALILSASMFAVGDVYAKPSSKNQIKKNLKESKIPSEVKTVTITKVSKSRTLHIWHIVEIQVCAGAEKLYSPDIELRSDRDTIQVTVWGLIMPNTCKIGEFFIAANDADSISVRFASMAFREPSK
jgi:hypothetical protein